MWVSDAQAGWVKGEVIKLEGGQLRVRTEQGNIGLYKADDCPLQNPMSRMGVEVSAYRHTIRSAQILSPSGITS